MKCGLSEVVITPPLGSEMPGAGVRRQSTGIKDDLYVKAFVLETERQTVAFVVLDAIDVRRQEVEAIRQRAAGMTGLAPEWIGVSATHAHTSGPTIRTTYVTAQDDAYLQYIVERSADALVLAWNKRQPTRIGFALGKEETIAYNRRFRMKDGTVRTNPGVGNPDIVGPTGPIDPDVAVIRIDDANGKPLGIVTNYACHADVVGGLEYSGDFPGELSRSLKRMYGESLVSVFFQGASGNVNHIDVSGRSRFVRETHYIQMGRILAGEVIRQRERAQTADMLPLLADRGFVTMNYRKPTEPEVAKAREVLAAPERYPQTEVRLSEQALELAERDDEQAEVEIQALALDKDTALVALPAEMFVEFGLDVKARSPFAMTIVNELSNGSISGYVCTPEAYAQGGYENRIRHYSRHEIGAGQLFADKAVELLQQLKRKISAAAEKAQ